MFQNGLIITKNSWPFEVFFFKFQVCKICQLTAGKTGYDFSSYRNDFFSPSESCRMIDLLVFFWMFVCVNPILKRTVIYCNVKKHVCNLLFDVDPIFGKTSSFFFFWGGGTFSDSTC